MTVQTLPTTRLDDATDTLLVERAGDGDVRAFEVLARRYGPLMRAYARRLVPSQAEADDVVQEALIAAWKESGTLRDGAAVKGWLLRIVSHRAIDQGRRRKSHADITEQYQLADPRPGPEQSAQAASAQQALTQALAKLPEVQRRCWVLKEYGDLSYEEIAAALDISAGSVRGRLARARIMLMSEMEAWR